MTKAKEKATVKLPRNPDQARPQINTYDSGYEHSVEHLAEVRRLCTKETSDVPQDVSARRSKWSQAV